MADPRDATSRVGTNPSIKTFAIDGVTIVYSATAARGSAVVDRAVSLSAAGTVQLTDDADEVIGKLLHVEPDGFCAVQVGGVMTLPGGDAATLTLGTKIVGDLGAAAARGHIRSAASAVAAELLVARGQILDAADTANVEVDLG